MDNCFPVNSVKGNNPKKEMMENRFTKVIVPFYLNKQTDSEGRLLSELWELDNNELEDEHDYIQWLFPLREASIHNHNAPIVNDAVIEAFLSEPRMRRNLLQSLKVMLRFYGLELNEAEDDTTIIAFSDDYEFRKKVWLRKYNHNYLRLTRILKCLMMFGLEEYAGELYDCLQKIYDEEGDKIGEETLQFWTEAVNSV